MASLVISCTYCTKMSQAEQKLCIFFFPKRAKKNLGITLMDVQGGIENY